ncbi:MAG: DUF5317 domain-containing protein [Chloroflexota bacterium]
MILLVAIIAGLTAGLIRAKISHRPYHPFEFRYGWLVLVALFIQWLAFGFPPTRTLYSDEAASVSLVLSQFILLIFAWFNRKIPGFLLLAGGLVLNLLVISLNGGFMPISPETVQWLRGDPALTGWQVGERLGTGKDIVLPIDQTKLEFLADRFRTPYTPYYRVAFSAGDVLIAIGAFWLLWSVGGRGGQDSRKEN